MRFGQGLVSGMLLVSPAQPVHVESAPNSALGSGPHHMSAATAGSTKPSLPPRPGARVQAKAMLYDGAVLAGGAALQAGAFVWTYRHHTPALSHGVAAIAVSEMLLPLAKLAYQHYRGQTPGMPPGSPPGPWGQAFESGLAHSAYALKSVWSGVTYGLWLGTLASQLGVASLWGAPLAIGVGVLGATCAVAIVVYLVLPQNCHLDIDIEGVATLLRLKVVALACQARCRLDDDDTPAFVSARDSAQQAYSAHCRRMRWQTVQAVAHPMLWRDELIIGVALGLWQGTRCMQGHVGVKGALTSVMLLFPMAVQVFTPLSCGQARTGAKASGRWVFGDNNQAHSAVQNAMRLALLSALCAAKPG